MTAEEDNVHTTHDESESTIQEGLGDTQEKEAEASAPAPQQDDRLQIRVRSAVSVCTIV